MRLNRIIYDISENCYVIEILLYAISVECVSSDKKVIHGKLLYTQWCCGKFSLVGTLAWHYMVTYPIVIGGGGGGVPELMVIYQG